MDHNAYCDALEPAIEGFATALRGVDPATPVPTCAPWDTGQLAKHIGMVHRWAMHMVRDLARERLNPRQIDMGMPADRRDFADWVAAGGVELVATLRAADPDAPMWAWGPDQHARFWPRRMLHETNVHGADARIARGQPIDIDATIAIDGVDEFLDNLAPAAAFSPKVDNLRGAGETIHLHCTDADGEWMIELVPDGFRWDRGHGKGTVAVRGTATDLLLLVYGRYGAAAEARFVRFGDTELLDWWIANSALE